MLDESASLVVFENHAGAVAVGNENVAIWSDCDRGGFRPAVGGILFGSFDFQNNIPVEVELGDMVHASRVNIFLAVFLVDVQAMIAPAFFAEGFDETAVGVIDDQAVRPISRHIDLATLINHDAAMSGADVIMPRHVAPVRHHFVGPFALAC